MPNPEPRFDEFNPGCHTHDCPCADCVAFRRDLEQEDFERWGNNATITTDPDRERFGSD